MSHNILPVAVIVALTLFLCWFRTFILNVGRNDAVRPSSKEVGLPGERARTDRRLPAPLWFNAIQARLPSRLRVVAEQGEEAGGVPKSALPSREG